MCSIGWLTWINYVIEQPLSSLLGYFPCVVRLFHFTHVEMTNTYLGNFGAPSQKPVKLWHTTRWVKELSSGRPPKTMGFETLVRKGPTGRVTGIRHAMKESQAYPRRFGLLAGAAKKAACQPSAAAS